MGVMKRHKRLFLISLVMGIGFFWLTPVLLSYVPLQRKTNRIGVVGRYDEKNLPQYIINNLSIGLTQIDETGQPYPGLAKNWEAAEDGTVWTFHLDTDLTWSDKQPIQAGDIHYNFDEVQTEVVDPATVRFVLPEPFGPFPVLVSRPLFKDGLIGQRYYRLAQAQRNGAYFEILVLRPISRNSTLPILEYHFYGTEEAARLAFKLGQIDEIKDLREPYGFDGYTNALLEQKYDYQSLVGLYFNMNDDHPELQQKQIRQGLAYAIRDKSFDNPRAISAISDVSWAYNPDVKPYDYDLERARDFLGSDDNPNSMSITLTTTAELLPVAEQIAEDWKVAGVETTIKVSNVIPQNFDALLIKQEIPQDPDQYALWHSTQPANIFSYKSPKIDKLLEDGRRTIKPEDRKVIYHDFQRFLNEDVPAIFLYHPSMYDVARK